MEKATATQPVEAQPPPMPITVPATSGPTPLARLKATWFMAAARVWASPAAIIRRVCSGTTRPPLAPIITMATPVSHALPTLTAYSAEDSPSTAWKPRAEYSSVSCLMNPARKLPAVDPTP
ncbi:hypothetical protein A5N15_04205 [Rothia kristinae]|uniref:Uncharacterized protein n=1 Tax=Rothia kristinae TaxID=37923 RepID=A0A657IWF2_9MICC|nr:hypothetical protein A5N15_04205 [Rothia kristinae]